MTIQTTDTCFHSGTKYEILEYKGDGLFDPKDHGITPGQPRRTSCQRGFYAHYRILGEELRLQRLVLFLSKRDQERVSRGEGPTLFGKAPVTTLGLQNIDEPIRFHGALLLGADYRRPTVKRRDASAPSQLPQVWDYRQVREVVFEAGRLTGDTNLNGLMAELRVRHERGDAPPPSTAPPLYQRLSDTVSGSYTRLQEAFKRIRTSETGPLTIEIINDSGFAKCPHCGISFSLSSDTSWDGRVHKSCGGVCIVPDWYTPLG
jgi:hypothetical protein